MTSFHSNPQLELAFEYVRNTHKNIFLTGKAGTGKTTFLRQIASGLNKRMAVVAPTGVAAINAGGMTIHAFFQLPFGPFIPGVSTLDNRQQRFTREKIRLIKSLDLLVIDEISMVRADVLDGIDAVLRRFKDRHKPFGGVQLLMIGDLHQLPPVVKEEEWQLLRAHYQTAYFFGSLALKETAPITIELRHIYRQSDQVFIDLLNKVRDNQMDQAVLDTLNSRYMPNFQPASEEAYITLSAHNASAHEINAGQLASLTTPLRQFMATVTGDFPTFAYPTEETLGLKVGAQVMFVKNDLDREKRYFNGKIGRITRMEEASVWVQCPGESAEILVLPVEWQNLKYVLDEQSKEIREEEVGVFRQYPLRLAWAITIHKSQGLTFERAIIDAQAAFAHGQVYVALSRCKSFEGLVLRTKIAPASVKTDSVVREYAESAHKNEPNEAQLWQAKKQFQENLLRELFDFNSLQRRFEQLDRLLLQHANSLNEQARNSLQTLFVDAETDLFSVAARFIPQLNGYFSSNILPEENGELQERLQKGRIYFQEKLERKLSSGLRTLNFMTDNKEVLQLISEALDNLQKECFLKKTCFASLEERFTPAAYLRARSNADLDYQTAQKIWKNAGNAKSLPSGRPHAILASRLFAWRNNLADELQLERYQILTTKSVDDILRLMPGDLRALKKVKGIGEQKLRQFGNDILQIIADYCAEAGFDAAQLGQEEAPERSVKQPKVESRAVTLEMYQEGKSLQEIAIARNVTLSTIEGHLSAYIAEGKLNARDFMPVEQYEAIEVCLESSTPATMSEVRAALGEAVSYGAIRMVLAQKKAEQDTAL